jgi:hypothetical protein
MSDNCGIPVKLAKIPKALMRPDLERRLPLSFDRFMDLTGQKFARCEVLGLAGYVRGYTVWLCRCNCGKRFVTRTVTLRHRKTGCGCADGRNQRHGHSESIEYSIWRRLRNDHRAQLCKRWQVFANFLKDMGPRPGRSHFLVRVDRGKPYSKSNCKWSNQKRGKWGKLYSFSGEHLTLTEWAERLGMSRHGLEKRIKKCEQRGVPIEQAFATTAGEPKTWTRGRPRRQRTS